jgi:hypothetical protein
MSDVPQPSRIGGLEQLLKEAAARPDAPVERWNPPYCGDIGLAIRADGTWTYRDSPIARPALVKLFARVLRRDPDGRTFLVTPAEKIDVAVADAPFLAVEMEVQDEGQAQRLIFRTNVDDVVTAGVDHPLSFAQQSHGGLKPYVLIRGRLDALATRAVAHDLLNQVSHHADRPGIWSDGAFFPVPQS